MIQKDLVDLSTIIAAAATLFGTVAAFWGIRLLYLAYISQKEELGETKKALRLQKDEMTIQRIESTYLSLLDAHNRFVETLYVSAFIDSPIEGKNAFTLINSNVDTIRNEFPNCEYALYSDYYWSVIYLRQQFVRSYVRSVDVPMKYLQKNALNDEDRRFYSDIHLSQLSVSEFEFIQNFCHAFQETNKFVQTRQRMEYLVQLHQLAIID